MRVLPWCLPVVSAMRSMLTALTVGLATLCWISDTAHAQSGSAQQPRLGPSFPCPSPYDPLAQLICSHPDLWKAELRAAQAFQALYAQLNPTGQRSLSREWAALFETVRSQCGIGARNSGKTANPTAIPCVRQHYISHRDILVRRLTGAAVEEVARPLEAYVALQADLKRLGFLPSDAVVDGEYGPITRTAIRQWQQSRGRRITGFLDNADGALLEQQAALLQSPETRTATASSPVSPTERNERERAAENARRRLEEQAAEDKLNRNLKERGFQLVSPVDLNLDWRDFMANNTKVAVRGTYFHSHDVEALSTPENKDQPTIRLYTNDATRDARKLMLECRNSNFKYSLCEMIVGATIKQCIRNKGGLNEKEIPCLNVQEAYLVP